MTFDELFFIKMLIFLGNMINIYYLCDRPPKNESFRSLLRNNDFHFILAVIKGKNDIDKIIAYIDNNLSNQRKKAI